MFKKMIITAATVTALSIGVVAINAQDDPTVPETPSIEAQDGERGGRFGSPRDGEGRGTRLSAFAELAETYTGLTREELREELRNGATLADLITANGQSVDAFVDEAVSDAEARIDEAVANGRLTEEEATEKKAELESRVTERVNGTFERPDRPNRPGRGGEGAEADADV